MLLKKLAMMERRVRGELAVEESGLVSWDIVDKFVKRKASSVNRVEVTVVGYERVDRLTAWAGQADTGPSQHSIVLPMSRWAR